MTEGPISGEAAGGVTCDTPLWSEHYTAQRREASKYSKLFNPARTILHAPNELKRKHTMIR